MLTISKPMSAGQASAYHAEEFTNATENYYTEGNAIRGHWHGQLAAERGLTGEVEEEAFNRLAAGQHPETGEQLVRYQQAREYVNDDGELIRTMEHRAGWDATFSAPKSVSLTALVGGDERVREAHRESVRVALDETERYVQARIGGNAPAVTTGKWAVASFEHDSARPVDTLRRAATAHACRLLQHHRNRRRKSACRAAAGTLPQPAIRDSGVSK